MRCHPFIALLASYFRPPRTEKKPVLRAAVIAAAMGLGCVAANAGVVFNVSGQFSNGANMSGTMTIDTAAGVVDAWNITLGAPISDVFNTIAFQQANFASPGLYLISENQNPDRLDLYILANSLVGYSGGLLSSTNDPGGFISRWIDIDGSSGGVGSQLVSGQLTQAAVGAVPEPASLALAGLALGALVVSQRHSRRR